MTASCIRLSNIHDPPPLPYCWCHADYVFSTMDPDFLALNFEAVVQEVVPWAYISHKSGVTGELADRIARARSTGKAISEFAAHRNEAVIKR